MQTSTYGLDLAQIPTAKLAAVVASLVNGESPILFSEVVSRVARNTSRLGMVYRRTEKAFDDAVRLAVGNHMIVRDGGVLWGSKDL